jgi:hypothetical protein
MKKIKIVIGVLFSSVLIIGLTVFVLLQTNAIGPLSKLQYDKEAYKTLRKADTFSYGGTGYGGDMSTETQAYVKLYQSIDAKEVFVELEKDSNMQGKLYALSALYYLDKELYDDLVEKYTDSQRSVDILSGCLGGTYDVRDVIRTDDKDNLLGADFYSGKIPELLRMYITE